MADSSSSIAADEVDSERDLEDTEMKLTILRPEILETLREHT